MAVFERSTPIRAPLDDVWAFHATAAGLEATTPDWFGLRVESVVGPDGESVPDGELAQGTTVSITMRPFGIGPAQSWTSQVTQFERGEDRASFRDEMTGGPFRRWEHTHRFTSVPAGTLLTDRVVYELPLGPVRGLSGLAWPGFALVFAARHRRTRRLLEAATGR